MECEEIRNLLSDYIDGELSEETASQLARHLESCPGCSETYREMTRLVGMMREMETVDEPPDLVQNVRARLAGSPSFWERLRGVLSAPAFRVPAAAAVLAAALLLVLYVPTHHDMGMRGPEKSPTVGTAQEPVEHKRQEGGGPALAGEKPAAAGSDLEGAELSDAADVQAGRSRGGEVALEENRTESAAEPSSRAATVEAPGIAKVSREIPAETETSPETPDQKKAAPAPPAEIQVVSEAPAEKQTSPAASAEKRTDVLARAGKGKDETLWSGVGAAPPETSAVDSARLLVANEAARALEKRHEADEALVPEAARQDTISIAVSDEKALLDAVALAHGKITRSTYDDQQRLTAIVVEIPGERYETFLQRLLPSRDQAVFQELGNTTAMDKKSRLRAERVAGTLTVEVKIHR